MGRPNTGPHGQHYSDSPYYREPSIEEFARDLARANQFTLTEVESNRNGFMSTRQFFRLLWQASKPFRAAAWSVGVWLGLLFFINSMFRIQLMRVLFFHNYAFEVIGVSVSLGISLVAGALNTTKRTWDLIRDLQSGEVTSVEGRLNPSWGEEMGEGLKRIKREMVPYYRYTVRQEDFDTTPEAYELLMAKYSEFRPVVRIYFSPRSRMLLSIEPVVTDPSKYNGSAAA